MSVSKLITYCFFLCCIVACNNDDEGSGNNPNPPVTGNFADNFGSDINRTFLGRVININYTPIEGVSIVIGNTIATTDENGVFVINDAQVFERFAYVKAEKAGYIHGSRAVIPSTGTNKVTIMLLEEIVAQTINSGDATTVTLANGASLSLEGNFKKEDGSAYDGSVNVIMHLLDPTDDAMELQMPGMLYAENTLGEERMLQTMGMLAVELRGDNGEDLNLADGSTSEIKIPVAASLLANAPSTIPLWYFDETNGYWKEEGQATLIGNEYVGTVSHFSFWNADAEFPAANLCITITDENGNPLANQTTTLTHSNPDYLYPTTSGYTNDNGQVCGLIPLDELLELNVYNYDACGNSEIYTESIGPFSEDSNITVAIENTPDVITETVTATFNDCEGNPVTNGYVVLIYDGQLFYDTINDGTFELNIIRCSEDLEFSLEALNYNTNQTTGLLNFSFSTPTTNLGTLASCDAIERYITYQVDDHPIINYVTNLSTFYEGPGASIIVNHESELGYFSLDIFNSDGAGAQYNTLDHNIGFYFSDSNGDQPDPNNINIDITFNVATIAGIDNYLFTDIAFYGTYELDGVTHDIAGTIHVN